MPSQTNPLANFDLVGHRRMISNPLFSVLRSFIPERIKEVFLLCDFLVYNSEQVLAALKKFSEYPVTSIRVTAKSDNLTRKYENLLSDTLNCRKHSIVAGFDLMLYGNSFTSIYYPFTRYLVCTRCKHRVNMEFADYTFESKSFSFSNDCANCSNNKAEIVDEVLKDPAKLSLIRWDPKDVSINYDNLSDTGEYYLRISPGLVNKVVKGDKFALLKTPLKILETMKKVKKHDGKKTMFKFHKDELLHMKLPAPAGINYGWGIPPVMGALNAIFYVNTLRKANEAIALERMLSFRVLHPGQGTANAEPAMRIRLGNWVNEMKRNYQNFRVDNNHIMFSPVPVTTSNVGGDGKLLLTVTELEAAETNILLALGIPREFVYGGLNNLGGSITLRNLENQLENHRSELTELNQWVADRMATFLKWAPVKVEMEEFKLIDDVQQKAADLQLFQLGLLSEQTITQLYGHDYKVEQEQRKKEGIQKFKHDQDVNEGIADIQNMLAEQVRGEVGAAQGPSYNPEEVLAQAQPMVDQLLQLPHEDRRSQLHQLQQEDFVLYAVVAKLLQSQQSPGPDEQQQQGGGY